MLCGGRVIQPRMYDALRWMFLTGEPNHDFRALGWPHKVRGNQDSAFHPSVPNVMVFQMHLEGKGLEREPSNKKLHCSGHCLQAFCLNFHNNPLCYRDHKGRESGAGTAGSVQEDQLSAGPWLWNLFPLLTPPQAEAPDLCLPWPLCPHSSLWAVDSSRQGAPRQLWLSSIRAQHLASCRQSVRLSEGGNE